MKLKHNQLRKFALCFIYIADQNSIKLVNDKHLNSESIRTYLLLELSLQSFRLITDTESEKKYENNARAFHNCEMQILMQINFPPVLHVLSHHTPFELITIGAFALSDTSQGAICLSAHKQTDNNTNKYHSQLLNHVCVFVWGDE